MPIRRLNVGDSDSSFIWDCVAFNCIKTKTALNWFKSEWGLAQQTKSCSLFLSGAGADQLQAFV